MTDDVVDRIAKYKDAPGVYFHIRETLEKSRDEILRLRSALAALVHGATRYDENPDSAVARAAFDEALAAAIRSLPSPPESQS